MNSVPVEHGVVANIEGHGVFAVPYLEMRRVWLTAMIKKEHLAIKHENCKLNYCPICDGGLIVCSECGSAGGAITSSCPPQRISGEQLIKIYRGELDYDGENWVNRPSKFSPAYWSKFREYGEEGSLDGQDD
jgi:hypothetical protein